MNSHRGGNTGGDEETHFLEARVTTTLYMEQVLLTVVRVPNHVIQHVDPHAFCKTCAAR